MITTREQLEHFFAANHTYKDSPTCRKALSNGVLVSSKLRKDFLCSESQGKVVLGADVVKLAEQNLGGGVWRLYVDKLD